MENQPTFCPTCGKEIEAGSAFCTNCGAKLRTTTVDETSNTNSSKNFVTEQQKEILKKSATNLWSWAISAIKAPTKSTAEENPIWFNWLAFLVTAIFGTLTLCKILVNIVTSTSDSVGNALGSANDSLGSLYSQSVGNPVTNTANHVFGQIIFPVIISFIILHGATILGAWLANFAILGDKTYTFQKILHSYGRFYVLLFAMSFVSFLFALIHVNVLAIFIAYLAMMLWTFISFFSYINTTAQRKMDTFYIKLLAWLANCAVLGLAFLIVFAIMGSEIATLIRNATGGLL
ncbi:DUF6574 domain-containing protein [Lactococcus nasutitermitis]|uniref:DUF6574 domain-containing protein n=1 Tax=Lactococcus nasutitermitis TaxID=1652957 RepID=A0ABV9JAS7_9LACT|nr:zinc ribbon domain-containing protein [Lactococcus nasutitermitis]